MNRTSQFSVRILATDIKIKNFIKMINHIDYSFSYSSVRVIASRILHEICLLVGELAIRGTNLTLNARLGTKGNLLIEQYCY